MIYVAKKALADKRISRKKELYGYEHKGSYDSKNGDKL